MGRNTFQRVSKKTDADNINLKYIYSKLLLIIREHTLKMLVLLVLAIPLG